MKCTIPEISWHNREPVLSLDVNSISDNFYRLATGGADCHVLIWQLDICDNGAVKIEILSDLTRHQRAINAVRWSPSGQYLASADDDANIIIWQLKTDNIPLLEGDTTDKETWIVNKVMRGHKDDIYDLCWSPNGSKILSGSVDNTAILWDFKKGQSEQILTDHKGFVQGVSWDPKNQYLATISTDRICRIYETSGRQVKARICKGILPVPVDHYLHNYEVKFFHDDTFKSFFRRLHFSPEGTILAVPSGHVQIEDNKKTLNATYIFAVESWTAPIAVLPSREQCSTVVRFCPTLFELQEDGPEPILSLPYRMILAVGTDRDIILYDTQQLTPFAYFRDIHYTRLTDLTWSKDGQLLLASSTDGFCALITFEPAELGVPYIKEESDVEDNPMEISGCEELEKDLDTSKELSTPKCKKSSFLEKWTIKTPKLANESNGHSSKTDENGKQKTDDVIEEVKETGNVSEPKVKSTVKRITPIPVIEPSILKETKPIQIEAKPIAVRRKPKEVETTKPPLKATLLNFVKTTPKSKSKKLESQSNPLIVLHENEARDAWKCEKEQKCDADTKLLKNNEGIMNADEYSEDISLHLEDTSELTDGQKGAKFNEANQNLKTQGSGDEKSSLAVCRTTDKEPKDCEKVEENTSNSRAAQTTTEIVEKDSTDSMSNEVPQVNKINTPKRRIPLITLSSPKQRKK